MLISYNELCEFAERGVIAPVDPKDINGTSIDVQLSIGRDDVDHLTCTANGVRLRRRVAVFAPAAGVVDQDRYRAEVGLDLVEEHGRNRGV